MVQVKRITLAVLLAVMVGFAVPVYGQDATDEVVIVTNTPQSVVEAPVIVEATPVVEVPDVTVEVPPVIVNAHDPQLLYIAFTVIVLAVLATLILIGRPLIVQLGASAPAWAVEGGIAAGESALKSAEQYAKSTPAPYDDVAVAELRREFEGLKEEVRTLRMASLSNG